MFAHCASTFHSRNFEAEEMHASAKSGAGRVVALNVAQKIRSGNTHALTAIALTFLVHSQGWRTLVTSADALGCAMTSTNHGTRTKTISDVIDKMFDPRMFAL